MTTTTPKIGETFRHDGATYTVETIHREEDQGPNVRRLWQERGQVAYLGAKRGTRGFRLHLFRVYADGSTRFEQTI